MGRKSRLKQERKQQGLENELRQHPMRDEIQVFLQKRRVDTKKASGLLYLVSLVASLLIYRSIKKQTQLPVISPEEDKADENRLERLGEVLEYECRRLRMESNEVINELVFPMAGNRALMEPILSKVYEMLDALVPTDDFRLPTQAQIENPDLWGDSLTHHADREEDYFQAVKDLFTLVLTISRSAPDESDKLDNERRLEEIREAHGIELDDFLKLRRRATEFFRIAFAKYLSMTFQPVRNEVDEKILMAASTSSH